MDNLWAPWRMEYIRAPKKNNGTTFSSKLEKGTDEENLILFKGDYSFVCMNLYPYNNGHLLLVPYKIVDKPEDLNKAKDLAYKGVKKIEFTDSFYRTDIGESNQANQST